jgi:hypothetical protein
MPIDRWSKAFRVNAGAAVARGTVYRGSGYARGGGSAGNKLYAFAPEETDS